MLKRAILYTLAAVIIAFAILINLARIMTPWLAQKKPYFEHWASQILGQPVIIRGLQARWVGFEPQLAFDDVIVGKPSLATHRIFIKHFSVSIDVLHSLLRRQLLPGRLIIDGTHLTIVQNQQGAYFVAGLGQNNKPPEITHLRSLLVWLLTQADVSIKNVSLLWRNQQQVTLPVSDIQLQINNDVFEHHIAGVFALKQAQPTRVKFILNLKGDRLFGQHFNADLYLHAEHIVLPQWQRIMPKAWLPKLVHLSNGQLSGQLWSNWRRGQLVRLQTIWQAQHIAMPRHLMMNKSSGTLLWQRLPDDQWLLAVRHLRLRINGLAWRESGLELMAGRDQTYALHLAFLRLQDLPTLLQLLPSHATRMKKLYGQLKPRGEIQNLALQFQWPMKMQWPQQFQAQFQNVSINPWQHLPGFKNLTGNIHWHAPEGRLTLTSSQGHLNLPHLVGHVLPFKQFQAHANLRWLPGQFKLTVSRLLFNDGNLKLAGQLTLDKLRNGKLTLSALANASLQTTANLKHYLFKPVMTPVSYGWLKKAYPKGKISRATILFRGPLAEFPFDHHAGNFEVDATLKQMTLHYAPGWPVLSNANCALKFHDRAMQVNCPRGIIVGNVMRDLSGSIKDLNNPVLEVRAQTVTPLSQALIFLRHTPLPLKVEFNGLTVGGRLGLQLRMHIPLLGDQTTVKTLGRMTLMQAKLGLSHWGLHLDHIQGVLAFTDQQLSSKLITAHLNKKLLRASVTTLLSKQNKPVVQIALGGKLYASQLQPFLPPGFTKDIAGSTPFRALFELQGVGATEKNHLSVMSDLTGLSLLHLPIPFAKRAAQKKLLHLQVFLRPKHPLRVRAQYGQVLSMALSGKQGEIVLGGLGAQWQREPGLLIRGILPYVNWTQWRSLFSKIKMTEKNDTQLLRQLHLQIGRLDWDGRVIKDIELRVTPQTQAWQLQVKSPLVVGSLLIPQHHNQTWVGRFSELNWPKSGKHQEQHFNLATLPPLDIRAKHVRYHGKKLGQLQMKTTPLSHGIRIRSLSLRSELYGLAFEGQWTKHFRRDRAEISGSFNCLNLGRLLSLWGYPKLIAAAHGSLNFAFAWPGRFDDFSPKHLSGEVKFNFADGRVLTVSDDAQAELGLGRLLNIFSFQSLSRRLMLDFSDLGKKGYEFSTMKGGFAFRDGSAVTNDAYFNGPVARIWLKGRVGFRHKVYDMHLQVAPYVTSSLPFIVGVAGGPIAGAVTWVVSKLIGPGIAKAAGSQYRVTGSWAHPKITKLESKQHVKTVRNRRSDAISTR